MKTSIKSRPRDLVYYTLYLIKTARSYRTLVEQHVAGVESLRRRNQSIPICLAVCGKKLRSADERHLKSLRVRVRHLGGYEDRLKRSGFGMLAKVFAANPNSPKWISLPAILTNRFDRVLCIDNDVFFNRDVAEIFGALGNNDVCAREEPWTKRSPLRYDPSYLDESALKRLQRAEHLHQIVPINTGVLLMNRRAAEWLSANLPLYLSYLVRFTIWMAKQRGSSGDHTFVKIARQLAIDETNTGLAALRYPCSNQWIIGQLALWFTFAARRFKIRIFPYSLVLQGDEFLKIGRKFEMPAMVHYYSVNSYYFFRWLRQLEQCAGATPDRGRRSLRAKSY